MPNDKDLQVVGDSQGAGIAALVAALQCDYGRLGELREAREAGDLDESDADELAELKEAAGDCEDKDEARERIRDDALSVEYRGDWVDAGGSLGKATEYRIVTSTGGPAARIVGKLDKYGTPTSARLEVQDWGTPWTEYTGDAVTESDLLAYAECFCFETFAE